jgi:hypothetical protein
MSSLDLSTAFDLVNVKLLIKSIKIIGLPNDMVKLINTWLKDKMFYVKFGENCLAICYSNTGIIQSSVLGPVLYAIFVSPIFDLTKITNFADDNFIVIWNRDLSKQIFDLEKELEMIVK